MLPVSGSVTKLFNTQENTKHFIASSGYFKSSFARNFLNGYYSETWIFLIYIELCIVINIFQILCKWDHKHKFNGFQSETALKLTALVWKHCFVPKGCHP